MAAAQTNITSLLATDIKIGEDDETKIDFETPDEIHFYAANAEQVYVADGIFGPQTDSDVDLGSLVYAGRTHISTVTVTDNVIMAATSQFRVPQRLLTAATINISQSFTFKWQMIMKQHYTLAPGADSTVYCRTFRR